MIDEALGVLLGLAGDFVQQLRVVAHLVGDAACSYGAAPVHAGELTGGAQVGKEGFPIHGIGGGSCGVGDDEGFAVEFVAGAAVREAVQEGFFHPAVQQGRHGEPEDGELEDDDIGPEKARLLGCCVDVEVWVEPVKVHRFTAWQPGFQFLQDGFVGNGIAGGVGVAGDDEDVFHAVEYSRGGGDMARLLLRVFPRFS